MRQFYHFKKTLLVLFTVLLTYFFFSSGCHMGNEPVPIPQTRNNKKEATQMTKKQTNNVWEAESKVASETPISKKHKNAETLEKHNTSVVNATHESKNLVKEFSCSKEL